jgi:hypothetical protein
MPGESPTRRKTALDQWRDKGEAEHIGHPKAEAASNPRKRTKMRWRQVRPPRLVD